MSPEVEQAQILCNRLNLNIDVTEGTLLLPLLWDILTAMMLRITYLEKQIKESNV